MRYLPHVLPLLLLVACAAETPIEPRRPPLESSVVFETADGEMSGQIVVGLLVPTPPSQRLVDMIPEDAYEAFLEREAKREAGDDAADLDADEEIIEYEELDDEPFEWPQVPYGETPSGLDPVLATVTREVESTSGVHVLFRHVLAGDCTGLPLVLTDEPVQYAEDKRLLDEYMRTGGRLLCDSERRVETGVAAPGVLPDNVKDVQPLVNVCVNAIRTSRLIHRFPEDPLAVASAERRGDVVRVRLGAQAEDIVASLRNLDNEDVATVERASDGTLLFTSPDGPKDPFHHRLVASWTQGGFTLRRAWRVVDLVGTAERHVLAPPAADAGSAYAPRVLFLNSLTGEPVEGREETMALVRGEETLSRVSGTSNAAGSLDVHLTVPEGAEPGPAELVIGEDRFGITLTAGLRASIVTDRPLYRPTDEVCVRVLVHTAALGRPVADHVVVLKLGDSEKTVRTSAYGIASCRFHLHEARLGKQAVEAVVGPTKSRATFLVRAFERPTFLVKFDPPSLSLRPGETAPVVVAVNYVNGSPMVGAVVKAWCEMPLRLNRDLEGQTDAAGLCTLDVRFDPRCRTGRLMIQVVDADGRTEKRAYPVEIVREEALRKITIAPLEEPILGRPCRFEVTASQPGPVALEVGQDAVRTVHIDESGRAVVSISPPDAKTSLRLSASGVETVERDIDAVQPPENALLLVAARRVATVGEALPLTILGDDGPAWIDVVRAGVALRSHSTVVRDGRADLDLVLDEDMAGTLDLRVWRMHGKKLPGSTVPILVVRGRSLAVTSRVGAESYRPGERAVVDVEVRDRKGEPTSGVLGYWGVDEALLAIRPWESSYEEVFDVLPASGTRCADMAASAERGGMFSFDRARKLLGPAESRQDLGDLFRIRHRSVPAGEAVIADERARRFEQWVFDLRATYVEAFQQTPLEELRTADNLLEIFERLVREGRVEGQRLLDPWGTPLAMGDDYRYWRRRSDSPLYAGDERCTYTYYGSRGTYAYYRGIPCHSAGPDLRLGTTDDLFVVWIPHRPNEFGERFARFLHLVEREATFEDLWVTPFLGGATNGLIGLGGGAGGAFGGRGGSRDLGTGGGGRRVDRTPVHVRRDFSPTLCFVPEAIVGPEGRARLEIPLKDSITTWRLRLVASGADGATGTAETQIRVSQPLHVEPWIATHLTVGDELELPVAVRNETDGVLTTSLTLRLSPHVTCVGDNTAEVEVAAGGTGAHVFRIRAMGRGRARVRIDADAGAVRDAIERIVHIRPNAREVIDVVNGSVSADAALQASFPPLAAGVERDHRVSVYASPLAETMGGLEGLLACPHG